ncbi:hypothetical protein M422DRAFT_775726 [Sphaerobolus stellatus SS14]|nr:hypothetical protein M422DRAFT_775726 [Sphaerobolus stellatus SS14]
MDPSKAWPPLKITSPWNRIALYSTTLIGNEDDVAVAALRSDPQVLVHLPFMPSSLTPEQCAALREERVKNGQVWDFHARFVKSPVASNEKTKDGPPFSELYAALCTIKCIDLTNRSAELGIMLKSEFHRSGAATEILYLLMRQAFEYPGLKLHRATFITGKDNTPMRGWFEAFGIEQEYHYREAWSDGKGGYVDAVGYTLLDREWPGVKKRLEEKLDKKLGPRS